MGSTAPAALLAEPLAELEGVIERLGQEDLHQVPSSCLGDDLRAIRCAIDRLEAEFSRRLERFDGDQGWVADGKCQHRRLAEPAVPHYAKHGLGAGAPGAAPD